MNCESCGHENIPGAHFCAKCGVQLASGGDQNSWVGRLVGGRFRVIKVLGEGGMGVVYEGEQQMGSTVRRVAIKTLHAHLSNDASVLARFHRECGTVSQLEHPNTIKFYDFGKESDGTLYIAMEYIDGKSLDRVIEEGGALSPNRAVKILTQICGALDEAHAQGVIHRDLKPENVVLGERLGEKDFVKVLDFGIAARTESANKEKEAKLTQQGMVLGTPPYMSPEQFTGAELDRRSDVYSLGVMAYEMLTGQLPFSANTPWQWATEHMTAQPFPIDQVPSGSAVPRPMRDAVMRALEKDPENRPATAGEFLKELKDGLAGATAAVSAPTEQMQALPAFAQGSRPASIPQSAPGSVDTDSAMSSTQGFQIPQKKGNGAVLILGAIGAIVLIGGGVLAMRGSGSDKDNGATPDPSASTGGTEDAPDKGDGDSKPTPDPKVVESPTPSPSPDPAPSPSPSPTTSPAPGPSPSPGPSPKPSPGPTPKPSPDPAPATDNTCQACISAAKGGNWSGALSAYQTCSPTGQSNCSSQARSAATSQVASAVKAGECVRAKSIANGAERIKASSSVIAATVRRCK